MKDTASFDHVDVAMCFTRKAGEESEYLILRKTAVYQDQRGRYDENPWEVPGGKIELDKQDYTSEDIAEEALRKLREETGLLGDVINADPANHFKVEIDDVWHCFYPCLLEVLSDKDVRLSENEHDDYAWVSSDEFEDVMTDVEIQGLQQATR